MKRKRERDRIKEIISVFIKHGMKDGIKAITNPVQVRTAIEELGPTFVKIGQILSTRPDILPETFINELQKLQDDVKPEKYEIIDWVIEQDLKRPVEEVFKSFSSTAMASASMAQVHLAQLSDGQQVVVKVQRPKARETMLNDIAILKRLSRIVRLTPQGSILNLREMVDELEDVAKKELDFLNEAENIKRFYQNNKDVKFITCPNVFDEYTTSNILVMEYIEGIKIADINALEKEGYDLQDMGSKLADNYFKQVFDDGFFHADPHPGNIIISGNKIAYIDFGMMGTLSREMQSRFNKFLYGVATRDVEAITQAVMRIGIKKGNVSIKILYSDIEEIYNKYIEASLMDIDLPQMINEVFRACRRNNISMPREITMLMKGVITIEGVVSKLAPEINIMDVAAPYVKRQIMKDRDIKHDMMEQLENLYLLSKSGLKLPVKLLELINSALSGKLKVQMEHINLEQSVNELNRMVNRIVFGLIVSSLIIGSSLVINADVGPKLYGISFFGFVGYFGAAVLGLWLIISILRSGKM